MQPRNVHLVCFSPTRTTLAVLEAIGRGTGIDPVTLTDVTLPQPISWPAFAADDLLVIGGPVYAGRLPATSVARFRGLKGSGGPAVVVAVYGNREFEDALVELADLVAAAGFRPVAGGAFIGEHSFNTPETPIAPGRPDRDDLRRAEAFGREVRTLVEGVPAADKVTLALPGNRPYRDHIDHGSKSPVTNDGHCIRCGACVKACPTGAITLGGSIRTDASACILCCACTRACPVEARLMNDLDMLRITRRVAGIAAVPREPRTWLGTAQPGG